MRIRWRGLELPGQVTRDDMVSTDVYGRFLIDPFSQGFGTTIGNSLRRVLLSSLEGAAITSVKIEGVAHEFISIDGVLEDVTDIILNIKGVVVAYSGEEPKTMTVERTTASEVRAGDIVTDPAVTIANSEHLIATLTTDVTFKAEFKVRTGRGYATAYDNRSPEQEIGVIPIDSVFSPVLRVRFRTEDIRVGQRTNYDRLIIEIWTDGTVQPEDALVEAGMILRKHLNPFLLYNKMGTETVVPTRRMASDLGSSADSTLEELLRKPVSVLNLSVRARNCLDAARITTLGELVSQTEGGLLRVRSFGKTSLTEVHGKLVELGLSLGMRADSEAPIATDDGMALDDRSEAVADVDATAGDTGVDASNSPADGSPIGGRPGAPPFSSGSTPMQAFTMED